MWRDRGTGVRTAYNELRKCLRNRFVSQNGNNGIDSVNEWLTQCDIQPPSNHITIICSIYGSLPYPHQERDRVKIINYLNKFRYHKFKEVHETGTTKGF